MPGLSNFGLSRSGSVRSATPQTTVASPPPANIKTPYWAGTKEEMQAAQAAPAPSRSFSLRRGRKPVAASKVTQSPTPAQEAPTAAAASSRPFSYEPLSANPYVGPVEAASIRHWQEQATAAESLRKARRESATTNKRSSSPPYIPREAAESLEQLRPLSPGSIFANGGTPPAPPAKGKAFKALSRGLSTVRKASLTPQHGPKISSPVTGSFQRGLPTGHVLEPQEHAAPLNLVGLEVAQAHSSRFGQPDFRISAPSQGAERALVASSRAEAHEKLTGEPAPAAAPKVAAPPVTKPKTAPRKVVNSTFADVMDAGMDDSWVPKPQAGQARVSTLQASNPTPLPTNPSPGPRDPFSRMVSKPLRIRKQPATNTNLPSTSVAPASASDWPWAQKPNPTAAPKPLEQQRPTPTQSPCPTPPTTGLAAALGARHASALLPGVTCTQCGKVVDAVAVPDHRCGKRSAAERDAQASDWSREEFYRANFGTGGEEEEKEVFVDTYLRPAHTSWRGVGRR